MTTVQPAPTRVSAHATRTARVARLLSWALIATTTLIHLPRLTPTLSADFYAYVSVAERLRAGDRLYADVWDNKDPYFYYALALAENLGAWGYLVLELTWVAIAVLSLVQLGRSHGMSRQWSLVVAWGIAPWCLLGASYIATMTELPGVAVVLAVLAAAARNRWVGVGVLLGVLLLLKLTFVPVAVAGAAVLCADRRGRAFLSVLGGGAASTAAGLGVLALRGELREYLALLRLNSQYADQMVDDGGVAGFIDHLSRVMPDDSYPGARIAACAIVGCVVVAAWRGRAAPSRLAVCAGVVAASCVVVLGLTGIWPHHSQVLAIPACLTLLALCVRRPPRRTAHRLALAPVLLVAAYLLGGATPSFHLLVPPSTAVEPLERVRGVSPEARSLTAGDRVATYSRLGRHDLGSHARGLDALELACRHFQQYPFNPQSTFSHTLECLPSSDVVFVHVNFGDQPGPPSYVRFASRAAAILERQFECTPTDFGQKCLRTDR